MKKCLVSGSFDPITKGHIAIIEWAKEKFDEVIVGVFVNEQKQYLFDIDSRVKLCEIATKDMPNVKVIANNGLVADYCIANEINAIVRGFRNHNDYSYETEMAEYNYAHSGVLTYLLFAKETLLNVSSSLVREWIKKGFSESAEHSHSNIIESTDSLNLNNSVKIQNDCMTIENYLPQQVLEEIRRIKNA